MTRAQFIERADELCSEHDEKLKEATDQLVSKPPPLSEEEFDARGERTRKFDGAAPFQHA